MILNLYNSKDASAAAIYGSRAANGVIVITTKKGTKGRVKVSFSSQVGVNTVAIQLMC
jgi:iron complex outermembrane receptor protein